MYPCFAILKYTVLTTVLTEKVGQHASSPRSNGGWDTQVVFFAEKVTVFCVMFTCLSILVWTNLWWRTFIVDIFTCEHFLIGPHKFKALNFGMMT